MCAHYGNVPKVVTIVINCAIPVIIALAIALVNHMRRQLELMTEDDGE